MARRSAHSGKPNASTSWTVKRFLVPGLLGIAVYYGVFGGEYSVFELRSVRASVEVEEARLADVYLSIDSLSAWADSLRTDSATIERVAREDFGMIRDGETLYRFAEADAESEEPTPPVR